MNERLPVVPDPRFQELHGLLEERLEAAIATMSPEHFAALPDPVAREVLQQAFTDAGADEGTLWLVDAAEEHLVPVFNSGPHADRIVGTFRQPLNAGLICMVFANEQAFVENDVAGNAQQSKLLDATLNVETCALIAVPFHCFKACRGVVSCVQLRPESGAAPPGFDPANLEGVQRAAMVAARLVEYQLLSATVGWHA